MATTIALAIVRRRDLPGDSQKAFDDKVQELSADGYEIKAVFGDNITGYEAYLQKTVTV